MKKILFILIFLTSSNIFSQTIDSIDLNKYYAKQETKSIKSNAFESNREFEIFLPQEYFTQPNKKFKVAYLFDSQNMRIFNFVKGTIEYLSMNQIEPLIIVGIDTEDRWFEFLTPNNHIETLKTYEPPIGGANKLMKHIIDEVEPYIKENYRVDNYRIGIGHSLGATFTMFVTMETNLFDYSILLSPNFDYDQEQFINRIQKFSKINSLKKKIYISNGSQDSFEEKFEPGIIKAVKILKTNSNTCLNYEKLIIHNHGNIWLEGVYKGLLNWKNKNCM